MLVGVCVIMLVCACCLSECYRHGVVGVCACVCVIMLVYVCCLKFCYRHGVVGVCACIWVCHYA